MNESTLSRVAHTWVTARADRAASWKHLTEALAADMADTQAAPPPRASTSGP